MKKEHKKQTDHTGKGHEGHKGQGDQPTMSEQMAYEMGHDGQDMAAIVRDLRNHRLGWT